MSQSLLDLCIGGWVGCYGQQPYKNAIALNATAEVDVTLPYLTLPYLTLPYLKLVNTIPCYYLLPLIRPSPTANRPLKHHKPQFYQGKTDLTRRSDCSAGALLGSKIHHVGSFLAQNNWQNLLFQQHSGQKAVLMGSNALHSDFIAHMILKSWNH